MVVRFVCVSVCLYVSRLPPVSFYRCVRLPWCVFDSSFPVGFLRSPPSEWSRVRSAASSVLVLRGYLSTYPSSSEDNTMPSILFLSTGEVGQFHLSRCPTSTQLNQHTRTNTYNAISNRSSSWGRREGGGGDSRQGWRGRGRRRSLRTQPHTSLHACVLERVVRKFEGGAVRRCARLAGCARSAAKRLTRHRVSKSTARAIFLSHRY